MSSVRHFSCYFIYNYYIPSFPNNVNCITKFRYYLNFDLYAEKPV